MTAGACAARRAVRPFRPCRPVQVWRHPTTAVSFFYIECPVNHEIPINLPAASRVSTRRTGISGSSQPLPLFDLSRVDWLRATKALPVATHLLPFIVRSKNIRLNWLFTLIKWRVQGEIFLILEIQMKHFRGRFWRVQGLNKKLIKDPPTYRATHQVWWTVNAIPTLIKNVFPHLLRFVSHRAVGHGRWRSMW